MKQRFFTSDLHFGHVNIMNPEYTRRGQTFPSLEAMNAGLIQRFNAKVGPDDEAYIIGDFAMGDKSKIPEYLRQMNGHKYLVLGNHDYAGYDRKVKVRPQIVQAYKDGLLEGFTESMTVLEDGHRLLLIHEPAPPVGHDYTLCGHVHESFSRATWDPTKGNTETLKFGVPVADPIGNILNVGVDVSNYEPMTLEELFKRPYQVGKSHRI